MVLASACPRPPGASTFFPESARYNHGMQRWILPALPLWAFATSLRSDVSPRQGVVSLDPERFREIRSVLAHEGGAVCVTLSPGGGELFSGGMDGKIRRWRARDLAPLGTFEGHSDAVVSLSCSPDGKRLASGGRDRRVKLWDARRGTEEASVPGFAVTHLPVRFAREGTLLYRKREHVIGKLNVLDLQGEDLAGHERDILCIALSPKDAWFASSDNGGSVILWNRKTDQIAARAVHGELTTAVAFHPNGKRLATCDWDGTIRIWRVPDLAAVATCRGKGKITWVEYSPDGRYLVSGNDEGEISFWSAEKHEVVRTLKAHEGEVEQILFAADGRYLATVGSDGYLRLWSR